MRDKSLCFFLQPNLLDGQVDISHSTEGEMASVKMREDDFDSKSGSENLEGASGEDNDHERRPKKKRYHRHTQHQIQEMEAYDTSLNVH